MTIEAWLAFQIEHGYAPDGCPVEMYPLYAEGRRAAFQATLAYLSRRALMPIFSNAELAKEAEREVAQREWVYPRRVAAGKMMQQAADRQLAMMRMIAAHFRALADANAEKDRLL